MLTPGGYVGAAELEEDDEPFDENVTHLTKEWRDLQAEIRWLDRLIDANLQTLANGGKITLLLTIWRFR